MSENTAERVRETVDAVYRSESRRILATLIRMLGDFDLAEDALHDAFAAAVERWPKDGIPANPAGGSFRPAGSRPLTQFGGAPGLTHRRQNWLSDSMTSRAMSPRWMTRISRTTGFG